MIYVPKSAITKELINELIEKGERFIVREDQSPVFWEPLLHSNVHEAWGFRDGQSDSLRKWSEGQNSYKNRYLENSKRNTR